VFTYVLKSIGGAPMPGESTEDTIVITGSNSESFGEIVYGTPGIYTYTVSQKPGSGKYYYDTSVYTLTVSVYWSSVVGGELLKTVVATKNSQESKSESVTFTNIKKGTGGEPEKPVDPVDPDDDKIDITVTKVWDDEEDVDKIRPDNVTVQLLDNGTVSKVAVISKANGWKHVFKDVPEKGSYSVNEFGVSGYTSKYSGSAADGFIIVNTHEPENVPVISDTTSVQVRKVWDDKDNKNSARPEKIIVQLIDSSGKTVKTQELNIENNWYCKFEELPKDAYSIRENKVDGYSASYKIDSDGICVITNTYIEEEPPEPPEDKTSVSVRKVWDDKENAEGLRPASVTIQLIRSNDVYQTCVLNNENGWFYKFEDLPSDSYTVKEISVEGYKASYTRLNDGVYVITNTKSETPDEPDDPPLDPDDPKKVNIPVKKIWNDNNNADGIRPNSIRVDLFKDGAVYSSAELSEANGWQYLFGDLPVDGMYTIFENVPNVYKVQYDGNANSGYAITNTYPTDEPENEPPKPSNPHTTKIPVQKIWYDNDNEAGIRPEFVVVKLIRNGSVFEQVILSEENGWKSEFTDVPVNDRYTVMEELADNYSTSYGGSATYGFAVYNKYTPGITTSEQSPEPSAPSVPIMQFVPGAPGSSPVDPTIPQTGIARLPVWILLCSGVLLVLLGISDGRRKRDEL